MSGLLQNITDPLAQWYQTSSSKAFFDWWLGELRALVPAKHRQALFAKSTTVFVVAGEDEAHGLWCQTGSDEVEVLPEDDSIEDNAWWHQLNHFVGSAETDTEVNYLLAEDKVLIREVALPVAAVNDVGSVLSFELDKYIPFDPSDAIYAYSKGVIEEGSEKFPVKLVTIKKTVMEEIHELVDGRGVQLSAVDVNVGTDTEPKALGVNLLPKSERKRKDWSHIKWNVGLTAVALLMLAFVMYNSLENKRSKIATLETQVEALKKDARRARLLETQLNESVAAANFLGNLKTETPSRIELLHELTKMIPSNTYLTRILINQERLEVVGQSDNANALIPILNQSETWYVPEIVGNVTQDNRTKKEKFTIKSAFKVADEEKEVNNES